MYHLTLQAEVHSILESTLIERQDSRRFTDRESVNLRFLRVDCARSSLWIESSKR